MISLEISRLAEQDLELIADYIARDRPRRALSFIQELRTQCNKIAETPLSSRQRPELAENLRSCAYGHYLIFFETDGHSVRIIRILHGAMDLAEQLQ